MNRFLLSLFFIILIYAVTLRMQVFNGLDLGFEPPLIASAEHGRQISTSIRIETIPYWDCQQEQCRAKVDVIDLSNQKLYRLHWYRKQVDSFLQLGMRCRVTGILKRPQGFKNPGSANYQWTLAAKGMSAYLSVQADGLQCQQLKHSTWRYQLYQKILNGLPDTQGRAVILALVLGEKQAIDTHTYSLFNQTGLSHLLAISGVHVGMLAVIGGWIGRLLWRLGILIRFPVWAPDRLYFDLVGSFIFAVAYTLLAGMPLSALRALLGLSIVQLQRVFLGPVDGIFSYMMMFVCLVVLWPLAPAATDFWLSTTAVGFILLGYVRQSSGSRQALLRLQLLLSFGLLPFTFTQSISWLAIPLNLILIPVFGFGLLPGLLIAVVALCLGWTMPLMLIQQLLSWSLCQAIAMQGMIEATLIEFRFSGLQGICLAFLLATYVRTSLEPLRLYSLLLMGLSFLPWYKPAAGSYDVDFLDVGQGTSILIRTHAHSIMYDTGPAYQSGLSAMDLTVLPFLRSRRIHNLDLLIVSHEDLDHSGGMTSLLNKLPVKSTLASFEHPLVNHQCAQTNAWWWDGVLFEWRQAQLNDTAEISSNNRSCILKISNGDLSVLIPGDIETAAEQSLLNSSSDWLQADILVAPHHGSVTSSSTGFIQKVDPDVVVIQAADQGRFNHPHPAVLDRYLLRGIKIQHIGKQGFWRVTSGD